MALPTALVRRMRRQRGLIRRAQVLHLGVPAGTLDAWLRRGELEVVERGVYRRPGTEPPHEQALLAAIYRAGAGARATGASACALYRIEGFDLRERPTVAVPRNRRVRGVEFVVERRDLGRRDLATVAGIPAVTPYRALIDAAWRVAAKTTRVAVDDACRRRLVDRTRLLAQAVDLRGHRGAQVVRRLFTSGLLDQDGELERQLALLLADHDLWPAWGVEVLPGIVADACFPEASYIIECDGRRWHTIDSDVAADVSRTGVLRADGWHVDRVGDDDLRSDPRMLVATVAATRTARIRAGLGRPAAWRPVTPGRRLRPPR